VRARCMNARLQHTTAYIVINACFQIVNNDRLHKNSPQKKCFFYNSCCVMKTTLMTHRKGLYRSKSTFSFMFYLVHRNGYRRHNSILSRYLDKNSYLLGIAKCLLYCTLYSYPKFKLKKLSHILSNTSNWDP